MIATLLAALLATAPAPAGAQDDAARARTEFDAGSRAFQADRFAEALPHFQRAYELSGHRPAAIFALAQCERALEMHAEAIAHFEEFIARSPDPKLAEEARGFIAEMEALRSRAQPIPELQRAAPKQEVEAPRVEIAATPEADLRASAAPAPRVMPWVTAGAGGAAAIAGAVLWIAAGARASDLDDKLTTTGGAPITAISYADARAEADSIETTRGVAVAVGAVGVAAVVGGVLWLVLGDAPASPPVEVSGGSAAWSFSW